MAQLSHPVDPFGEVNVFKSPNGLTIKATILMVPNEENAHTGLAIDASASMQPMYGVKIGPFPAAKPNVVEPVARTMSAFLANFSSDAKCSNLYWACSPDGSAIEEIGRFSAEEVEKVSYSGPKRFPWGKQTKLLPPVRYFAEHAFKDFPWSIGVIITDGIIDDLEDVKKYCLTLGQEMASGQRLFLKLVLIGVGSAVDEAQMEELDDMFEGSNLRTPKGKEIDIWDHKIASEMQKLEEIFSEIVDEDMIVVESGRILDNQGRSVKEYGDGVPAVLKFDLPTGSTSFTLEYPGGNIVQDISEVLGRL
ncbi:MAG: VWA domain-containing protein [Planctomycetaceae bacterium]